jgi:hypothetical protein
MDKNNDELNFTKIEKDILRTNKLVKCGSIIFIGLIIVSFADGVFKINYLLNKKESTILISKSPNLINELDIKVIGSNFGPGNAPIKIYYGKVGSSHSKYMIKHISNNGVLVQI